MICPSFNNPFLFFFTNEVPQLLYYSHFFTLIVSMVIGLLVFIKSKTIYAKILAGISFLYSIFIIINLITWTNNNSQIITFVWSFFGIVYSLLAILFFYFYYSYIFDKDLSFKIKLIFLAFLIPIILITPTSFNISGFNLDICGVADMEGFWFVLYYYSLGALSFILVFILSMNRYFKTKDKNLKQKILLFSIGIESFLLMFFFASFFSSYLINIGLVTDFSFEQYGLFGMTIFMGFLAYLIVKFKAFNIKLLGAQALVWAMVILIGSQFLFIQSNINKVLNSITFIAVSISGLILVRSVKKVDHQRELLDIANKNQQSLLHFITHQVKGYLAKSRNIFDGMVAGDYDPISDKAKEMAKAGFDSDTKGVETVMAILKASDLKTGKTAFAKTKTNISALVAEIVESKKDVAVQKGLELSFEIEPNIETEVDQLQIKEVFKNLITNSILYTPKGTVHVVLKREQGKVKFSVIDTGVGLSEKDKSKLFTEGGKGEESSLVNVDSTGYGLYIAKQIVEQHDGTISAHSEGKDKGAEFFVELPL